MLLAGARSLRGSLFGAGIVALLGWASASPAGAQPAAEDAPAPVEAAPPTADAAPNTPPLIYPSAPAAAQAADAHASYLRGARAAAKARRWPEADRLFDQANALDPDDPALLDAWGEAIAEQGDAARAERTFDRAIELTDDDRARAERLLRLGRRVEPRDPMQATTYFTRALALTPQPSGLIDHLEAVHSRPIELMSPASLCPRLADLWRCGPPSRPATGPRCTCTVERLSLAPADERPGFVAPPPAAVLGAALLRLRTVRDRSVNLAYLVVQTRSGGWQLVDRVEEGWRPGAPFVRRTGRTTRFELLPLGGEAGEGDEARVVVVRADGEQVDGDFPTGQVTAERFTRLWVCQAHPAPSCVQLPVARRVETLPLATAATSAPTLTLDYALDVGVSARPGDGAVVTIRPSAGAPPPALAELVGERSLDELAISPATRLIPLR